MFRRMVRQLSKALRTRFSPKRDRWRQERESVVDFRPSDDRPEHELSADLLLPTSTPHHALTQQVEELLDIFRSEFPQVAWAREADGDEMGLLTPGPLGINLELSVTPDDTRLHFAWTHRHFDETGELVRFLRDLFEGRTRLAFWAGTDGYCEFYEFLEQDEEPEQVTPCLLEVLDVPAVCTTIEVYQWPGTLMRSLPLLCAQAPPEVQRANVPSQAPPEKSADS